MAEEASPGESDRVSHLNRNKSNESDDELRKTRGNDISVMGNEVRISELIESLEKDGRKLLRQDRYSYKSNRQPSIVSELSRTGKGGENRFYNLEAQRVSVGTTQTHVSFKGDNEGKKRKTVKKEKRKYTPLKVDVTESYVKMQRELGELIKNLWIMSWSFKEETLIATGVDTLGSTSATDLTFRRIRRNYTAFYIWQIVKQDVKLLKKEEYNQLYDGECYIIYAASEYGKYMGPNSVRYKVKSGQTEQHIHYWLGKSAEKLKWYAAAFKCVELDGYAGGKTILHREVQGKESKKFRSYFANATFKEVCGRAQHSETEDIPKLFEVKGTRNPFVLQLPCLSWNLFNSRSVMILQTSTTIFLWIGKIATFTLKRNGVAVVLEIQKKYPNRNIVFVDDGMETTLADDYSRELDLLLPLHKRTVKPDDIGLDDTVKGTLFDRSIIKLYSCSENFGKYRTTELKSGPLHQQDLNSDGVFVIDHGIFGIWIWIGKNVGEKERVGAIQNVRGYIKKKKYPETIPVTRVIEGYEPNEFKYLFSFWKNATESLAFISNMKKPNATTIIVKYDAETLYRRPNIAAKCQLLDDGSGIVEKFKIEQYKYSEVPKEKHNIFFSEECYVITYTYNSPVRECLIIYAWTGRESAAEIQLNTQIRTLQLDNEYNNKAHVVRIIQGREPPHFLQIFKGKMRTFMGGNYEYDYDSMISDDIIENIKTPLHYLLQVEGTTTFNSKAYEVDLRASSLNTNYCFILRKNAHYFIWCGQNTTFEHHIMAKQLVGSDHNFIPEGQETPEFWYYINGKMKYNIEPVLKVDEDPLPVRLYQLTIYPAGIFSFFFSFYFNEIYHFSQKDLQPEYHMLMDMKTSIIVWRGNLTEPDTHPMVYEIVAEYLQSDPSKRDVDTCVHLIKQGFEPPIFIGCFPNWNDHCWDDYKPYDVMRDEIEDNEDSNRKLNLKMLSSNKIVSKINQNEFTKYPKYPVEMLTSTVNLPKEIDPQKKELYLTEKDFIDLIKISYVEFKQLPTWKQQDLKRSVGLI